MFKRKKKLDVIEIPFGENDILVVEGPKRFSREQANAIRAAVEGALNSGSVRLMIFEEGVTVKVLHRPEPKVIGHPQTPQAGWGYEGL